MAGERVPDTRLWGNCNSPHRQGFYTCSQHYGTGSLDPFRPYQNRWAKRKANGQRRTIDRKMVARSIAEGE
jgi:hypothetical protein